MLLALKPFCLLNKQTQFQSCRLSTAGTVTFHYVNAHRSHISPLTDCFFTTQAGGISPNASYIPKHRYQLISKVCSFTKQDNILSLVNTTFHFSLFHKVKVINLCQGPQNMQQNKQVRRQTPQSNQRCQGKALETLARLNCSSKFKRKSKERISQVAILGRGKTVIPLGQAGSRHN